MQAAEWIDRVKSARGIASDYGIAKALGMSRQAVSSYRNGHTTLDAGVALRVAAAVGEDPAGVVIDQLAEREKDPAVRDALRAVAKRLCVLC